MQRLLAKLPKLDEPVEGGSKAPSAHDERATAQPPHNSTDTLPADFRNAGGTQAIAVMSQKSAEVETSKPPEVTAPHWFEVQFGLEGGPLGLVMDWSMGFPVVAGIVPESLASEQPALAPNIVLIGVNRHVLLAGLGRSEVEALISSLRPITLMFASPDLPRYGGTGEAALWRKRPVLRGVGVPSAPKLEPVIPTSSFIDIPDERAPLRRFNCSSKALQATIQRAKTRDQSLSGGFQGGGNLSHHIDPYSSKRNIMGRSATLLPQISVLSHKQDPFAATMGDLLGTNMEDGRRSSKRKLQPTLTKSQSTGILSPAGPVPSTLKPGPSQNTWGVPTPPSGGPDLYYQFLFDRPRKLGPGPVATWPLQHDPGYTCCLTDMTLVRRVQDAYDPGFRAGKLAPPDPLHPNMYWSKRGLGKRNRANDTVSNITCDMCNACCATNGRPLWKEREKTGFWENPRDDSQPEVPGWFWYCRRCKKAGKRYELCIACHAVEVLQAEGKYVGQELHPHYSRCEHNSLVRRPSLISAYPSAGHLRLALCDFCGDALPLGEPDCDVYICRRCPEELGLRFELCGHCAFAIRESGAGAAKLATLAQ